MTVYAASGTNGGTVQRSIDGGATWAQRIDNNFCTAQCFYDIAVAVDPTNADIMYLGRLAESGIRAFYQWRHQLYDQCHNCDWAARRLTRDRRCAIVADDDLFRL